MASYLELLRMERRGLDFSPTEIHRRLAEGSLAGRSEGSVARRMSNISSVMKDNGYPSVSRYRPTFDHVGTRVAASILQALSELQAEPNSGPPTEIVLLEQANTLRSKGHVTKPVGVPKPKRRLRTVFAFERSAEVAAWILQNAEGVCEGCKAPAPFALSSGYPYLEVHHVQRLADGGPDLIENAVAVCPNCHRRLHHSADAEDFRSQLLDSIGRLIDYSRRAREQS